MLSLPAWPSQDGPVHLYYTRVLSVLFSPASSPFRTHFFIKHLLPPYAMYYYSLLLLSRFMPLLTADRLVICGYIVSFVLGFRYAARAIGPNSGVTSLLASLLVLNWALGMGFANYCLSLSFALWAIGIWLRLGHGDGSGLELGRRSAFVALLVLITLTHPVPLLVVLAFGGLDLLCRYLAVRRGERPLPRIEVIRDLVTLACGSLCLLYVKAFTVAHPLQQRTPVEGTFAQHVVRRIKDLLITKNVEVLYGHWWQIVAYRVCLGLILLAATVFAVQQWRSHRREKVWTAGDSMMVYAVCVAVVLPLLPSDMSGAYYFFERLNILLWITMLLAASGWVAAERVSAGDTPPRQVMFTRTQLVGACAAVFSVVVAAMLLHMADVTLRPFAERDYQLAHTALPLRGQLAMVLEGGPQRKFIWAGPSWDPYYWDTVALLRRNDGIMVNAPWLDSPIIPLAETEAEPGILLSPTLANSPMILGERLDDTPALRTRVLSKAGIALFSPVGSGDRTAVPAILGSGWSCTMPGGGDYRLCTRAQSETIARLAH